MPPQSRNLHKEMNPGPHTDRERSGRRARRRPIGWALAAALLLVVLLPLIAGAALSQPLPEATGLRFGENGNRTRIVLDFDRKVDFVTRVETGPARLVVDLGEVEWRLREDAGRPLRGLTRGYEIATSDGRSNLAIAVAEPVRIASSLVLPPSRDSPFHRLVIDLVADTAAGKGKAMVAPLPMTATAVSPEITAAPSGSLRFATIPASRPASLAALGGVGASINGHAKPAARSRQRDLPVVVLDPGHGGIDPGATSADGVYEKDLVLEMARELRTLIERSGRYRVVLTRDGDEFIRLRDRIAKGRHLGGQVFISLHADSLRLTGFRGASIYTLSEQASDEEAAKFAALENKADVLTGADLSQHDAVVATILIDLAQRDTNNKSIAFADVMAEELARVTSLVKRHRRFAGFAVLKSPDVPSVLLELGYLSNPDDARNLAQADYRAKLGRAIVRSLDQYFAVRRS